eukprot:364053-Chlamydomonas_euryale.AAC.4
MAPEVVRGSGYDWRADIWSLGCTVIEMLSGTHPWPGIENPLAALNAIASSPGGPPRPQCISAAAAAFLDACLQQEPRERPSAEALLRHAFVAPPAPTPAATAAAAAVGTAMLADA